MRSTAEPQNKGMSRRALSVLDARSLSPVFGDFSKSGAVASPRGTIPQGQAMGQVKKAVLDLVKKLPADCTLEDVQYQLYVGQKVERSTQAAAAGRVTSHEQVKKRLSKWLAQ